MKNGSVELTKIDDIDINTKLANAVFNLLDADGELVKEGLKQMMKVKLLLKTYVPVRINSLKQLLLNITI